GRFQRRVRYLDVVAYKGMRCFGIQVAQFGALAGVAERRLEAVEREAAMVAGLEIVQPAADGICRIVEVGQFACQTGYADVAVIESLFGTWLVGIAESNVRVGHAYGCCPYPPIDRFACGGVCGGVRLWRYLSEKHVRIGPVKVDFADVDPFFVEIEFV